MHTFKYQKTLFHTILLLVFKIVESLQCILKKFENHPNIKVIKSGKKEEQTSTFSNNSYEEILTKIRKLQTV